MIGRSSSLAVRDLPPKNLNLNVTRAVIVIKIQTDLAPRDNFFARFYKFDQMMLGFVVIKFCIMRMNTDRRVNSDVFFRNRNRPPKIVRSADRPCRYSASAATPASLAPAEQPRHGQHQTASPSIWQWESMRITLSLSPNHQIESRYQNLQVR